MDLRHRCDCFYTMTKIWDWNTCNIIILIPISFFSDFLFSCTMLSDRYGVTFYSFLIRSGSALWPTLCNRWEHIICRPLFVSSLLQHSTASCTDWSKIKIDSEERWDNAVRAPEYRETYVVYWFVRQGTVPYFGAIEEALDTERAFAGSFKTSGNHKSPIVMMIAMRQNSVCTAVQNWSTAPSRILYPPFLCFWCWIRHKSKPRLYMKSAWRLL